MTRPIKYQCEKDKCTAKKDAIIKKVQERKGSGKLGRNIKE